MKTRAKSLMHRLHRLQGDIYNFQFELENKSERFNKGTSKQQKYSKMAELAGDSGFELDTAKARMQDVIDSR